jgi:hypothetical protein
MAGVLAATVLLLGIVAANGAFHQSLHQNGQASSGSCVLCLFVKGQVDLAQTLPSVPGWVSSSFESPPPLESIALVDFSYLVFPSRAPPALASLLTVVG